MATCTSGHWNADGTEVCPCGARMQGAEPVVETGPGFAAPNVGTPYVVPPAPIPVGNWQLATPWQRLGAVLLEIVLIVCTLLIGWLIWTLSILGSGQTPAKRLLNLRVVRQGTTQPPTYLTMLFRTFLITMILSTIAGTIDGGTSGPANDMLNLLGFIDAVLIFSVTRQRLTDRICRTQVLKS